MLSPSKKEKLINALKNYKKQYLDGKITELDESGTRIMVNSFLSDVLGYKPIQEIKTEYMIKGTYSDYMVQTNEIRHFLVEVKALSFKLSEKHLRQTVNYGANEGLEWAMLTNGKQYDFYKILFTQPIEERMVFSVDLGGEMGVKQMAEFIQYIHKDSVEKGGLKELWNKSEAIDHLNVASIIYSKEVIGLIRKFIRKRHDENCSEDEIIQVLNSLLSGNVDPALVKPCRSMKKKKVGTNDEQPKIVEPTSPQV